MQFKLFAVIIVLTQFQLAFAKHVYYSLFPFYKSGAPDGVKVDHLLSYNGQFPGPLIRAKINDTLHVIVHNAIRKGPNNLCRNTKTTVHFHGILQKGTPFMDGPDMVTQCPIPSGGTQTYVFKVKQSGTYWYHSHVAYQYTEGLMGPLIIDNTPEVYADEYDDEIIIVLSDWYHTSGPTNTKWFLSAASDGNEPIPFSNLLNGKGKYPCNATQLPCSTLNQKTEIFHVTRGKTYRIRVINASAMAKFFFSIPGHNLTVIEVDGVDTVQRTFDSVPIAAAQRYSFLVKMDAPGNEHWVQATSDLDMFNFDAPNINPNPQDMIPTVRAKLVYSPTENLLPSLPITLPPILEAAATPSPSSTRFPGEMTIQPFDGIPAPSSLDNEIVLNVEQVVDDQGVNHLTFNNITYKVGKKPLLALVLKRHRLPRSANPLYTKFNEVVQIILNNHDTGPHPFHLHGHTFWVLGVGETDTGDYLPSRDELVLNGVRRDTVIVQAQSWLVLRFITDNPGVWYFHCHINWHLQSGLAATIIEAPEVARRRFRIPWETRKICASVGVDL